MSEKFQVATFLAHYKQKIIDLLNVTNEFSPSSFVGSLELSDSLIAHIHEPASDSCRNACDLLIIFNRSDVVIVNNNNDDDILHINTIIIGAYHVAKWNTEWQFNYHIENGKEYMGSNTHDDCTLVSVFQLSTLCEIKIAERTFGVLYSANYELPEDVAKKFDVEDYDTSIRDKQEIVQDFIKHKSNCRLCMCPCRIMLIYWVPKGYEKYWYIQEIDDKETVIIDNDKEEFLKRASDFYDRVGGGDVWYRMGWKKDRKGRSLALRISPANPDDPDYSPHRLELCGPFASNEEAWESIDSDDEDRNFIVDCTSALCWITFEE